MLFVGIILTSDVVWIEPHMYFVKLNLKCTSCEEVQKAMGKKVLLCKKKKKKICHKEEVLCSLDPLAFFVTGSSGKRTFFAMCSWKNRMSYMLKKCMENKTVVLWPFFLLTQGLSGGSTQQPSPFPYSLHLPLNSTLSCSFPPPWLHVILGLPLPILPSTLNNMIFFT